MDPRIFSWDERELSNTEIVMENEARYIAVGSFVLSLFFGIIFFIIWINRIDFSNGSFYDIYFSGSVTGLRENETVTYRGVPIGKVIKIDIDPKELDSIRVLIEIENPSIIRESSTASLESKGLTGQVQVQILSSEKDSPVLKKQSENRYPIIKSTRSQFQSVLDETPRTLEKLIGLIDAATPVFSTKNVEAFSKILDNMASFSQALSNETADVDGFFGNMNKTLQTVHLAADHVLQFFNENRTPINQFTTVGLYEFNKLVSDLRRTSNSLDRILQKTERGPIRFLTQPSGTGVEINEK